MRRGDGVVRLGELLPNALDALGPKGVWTEVSLRKIWPVAVGERVAEHCWVRRLRGRTLEVGVAEDTWATELRYLSGVIVSRVNELMGSNVVSELVVRRSRSHTS